MKLRKSTILTLLLGLMLVVFIVGVAQTTSKGDQKKQGETCCAMDSCCCHGDSCDMKESTKDSGGQNGCCCCSGDSCDMKMEAKMNHSSAEGCCCNVKTKHKDTKSKQAKQKSA
jgi:hypothetical protein